MTAEAGRSEGVDWDEYWGRTDEPAGATEFAEKMAKMLDVLVNDHPRNVADFGCGPATTLFALAGRHPNTLFTGYDCSGTILFRNRQRVEQLGYHNLSFQIETLPLIKTTELYDLVLCFSTLHYIRDIEGAVCRLYDRVREGGLLIFNYPNVFTLSSYRRSADSDRVIAERFAVLLSGENILSQRRIRQFLGRKPRRFYSSKRHNVYVLMKKSLTSA